MSAHTDEAALAVANGMADWAESIRPIYDAADGIKAEMARRGYSETAQEEAATEFIVSLIRLTIRGREHP